MLRAAPVGPTRPSPRRWASTGARSCASGGSSAKPSAATLACKRPDRVYGRALDGRQEAHLIGPACSAPPKGCARSTLRLLTDELVRLEVVEAISHETVRQALKKTGSSRT